jgi:hypothetical protein
MLFLVKRREVPRECNRVNADAKKKEENCKSGHCVKYFFIYATARRTVCCEARGKERVYCKISPFTRQILRRNTISRRSLGIDHEGLYICC